VLTSATSERADSRHSRDADRRRRGPARGGSRGDRDKGADVVLDLVGGVMFRSALKCLASRGRLVEIAAARQREVSFDLADFYHNESRPIRRGHAQADLAASAQVLDELAPGFVAGDYRAAPIEETRELGDAQEAYRKVAAGAAGRIVLRPQG
jgi:NADPH2:quinone reductase